MSAMRESINRAGGTESDPFGIYSYRNDELFLVKLVSDEYDPFESILGQEDKGLSQALLMYYSARQAHLNEYFRDYFDFNQPEDISLFLEHWAEQKEKLQIIGDELRTENYPNGGMSVCIPIALSEKPETIERLVSQIKKSALDFGGYIRLVVWVNYREDDSDLSSEAQTQYLAFQDQFKALSLDNVYLEMALDKLDNPGQNISIARSNNMSAILADIASSRFGLDHQIMWLDADTTFLSPNFFSGVSQSLIDRPTQFVHPDLEYSLEWLSQDSQEWDQASKVLLIDEMARRVSKQVKLKSKKRPYYGNSRNELSDRLYPEESGLAFTVLTYLMSGGFLLNEGQGSYCLRRGIASWRIMYGHYPNVQNALHQQFENLRPSTISGDYVYWDDDSLIRLSARRIYLELCTHGLMALQTQRSASAEENYQLYSQRDQEAATHSPRFNPDLVFFYLRGRYFDKSGKAKEPGAEEACNHIARMMLNKNLELG